MKPPHILSITALCAVLLVSIGIHAADTKAARVDKLVTAEGFSPYKVGDVSSARHSATADALRRAVENAYGVLVEADTRTKDFALTEDVVHTTADGFVKSYRILEEGASGGMYRVKIEASVAPGNPERSLVSICKRLKEKLDPTFVVSSGNELTRRLLKSELSLLGLRVADSGKAGKPRMTITIKGEAEPDSLGEAVADTGVYSSTASADLEASDASGTALPSIGVNLPTPVTSIAQSQSDREAVRSAVKLWVRRNLPIVGDALLSPEVTPSLAIGTKSDRDESKDHGGMGVWEYGSMGVGRRDGREAKERAGERIEIESSVVRSLAGKVSAAVKSKSEMGPSPVTTAVMRFKTIGPLDASVSEDLLEDLSTALTKTGAFELVERDQIEKVLKELRIQNSGLVEGGTARKLGKLAGARLLIVGSISDRKDRLVINARLLDTETGRVCAAEQVEIDRDPEPLVLHAGSAR